MSEEDNVDRGWKYEPGSGLVMTGDGQKLIAEIRGWGSLFKSHGEEKAIAIQDARGTMLAAAPELLEACEAALDQWGLLSCTAVQKLAKAVAKAGGRTEPHGITSLPSCPS